MFEYHEVIETLARQSRKISKEIPLEDQRAVLSAISRFETVHGRGAVLDVICAASRAGKLHECLKALDAVTDSPSLLNDVCRQLGLVR